MKHLFKQAVESTASIDIDRHPATSAKSFVFKMICDNYDLFDYDPAIGGIYMPGQGIDAADFITSSYSTVRSDGLNSADGIEAVKWKSPKLEYRDITVACSQLFEILSKVMIAQARASLDGTPQDIMPQMQRLAKMITGKDDPLTARVLFHWFYEFKRKINYLQCHNPIMFVLYGPQASGKSKLMEHIAKPLGRFAVGGSLSHITDDRRIATLGRRFFIYMEELPSYRDHVKLKSVLTADEIAFRPLYTNQETMIPVTASFMAATNTSLNDLISDSTGMRRYYQVKTAKRMDWEGISSFDFLGVFKSIDQNDYHTYNENFKQMKVELSEAQETLRSYDAIEEMLIDLDLPPYNNHEIRVAEDSDHLYTLRQVYKYFESYCDSQKKMSTRTFKARMVDRNYIQGNPKDHNRSRKPNMNKSETYVYLPNINKGIL